MLAWAEVLECVCVCFGLCRLPSWQEQPSVWVLMVSTSLKLSPCWATTGWARCGEILSCSIRLHTSTRVPICTKRPTCTKRPNSTKVIQCQLWKMIVSPSSWKIYQKCLSLDLCWNTVFYSYFKTQMLTCTRRPTSTTRPTCTQEPNSTKTTNPPSCTTTPSPRPRWECRRGRGSPAGSKRRCRGFCRRRLWSCTKWVHTSVWRLCPDVAPEDEMLREWVKGKQLVRVLFYISEFIQVSVQGLSSAWRLILVLCMCGNYVAGARRRFTLLSM